MLSPTALDADACNHALLPRDARFEGCFFADHVIGHLLPPGVPVPLAAAGQLPHLFTGGAGRSARVQALSALSSRTGKAFQPAVWQMLRDIPHGTSRSYGDIAHAIGKPGASRAIGHAVGRNPISVIVPCHHVLGASGQLTGYTGDLYRKRALLALESGA